MALDRFIYFKKQPPKKEVAVIIEDMFSGIGKVTWDKDRWFIMLPGAPSFPFRRVKGVDSGMQKFFDEVSDRWIEVYWGRKNIDVMTRMTDEVTNCLARGLAVCLARFYKQGPYHSNPEFLEEEGTFD